jgi:hypothetical protein
MPFADGGGWSLVGPAVFKTVVGREERPGCVRFAHASANLLKAPGDARAERHRPGSVRRRPVPIEGDLMRVRLAAAALIGVLALSAAGCDTIANQFVPDPKIVTREATVAAVGAPGNGAFQYAVPDGLPLWPQASVAKVEKRAKGSKSFDETLLTADTYDTVLAGMVTALEKGGWTVDTIDASTAEAAISVLNVSGHDREGVITITQTPEGTTIAYLIAAPEKKK